MAIGFCILQVNKLEGQLAEVQAELASLRQQAAKQPAPAEAGPAEAAENVRHQLCWAGFFSPLVHPGRGFE